MGLSRTGVKEREFEHILIIVLCAVTGMLGTTPGEGALKGLPTSGEEKGRTREERRGESSVASIAKQTSSLMALLNTTEQIAQGKATRVWLGEGLGSIPKRTYDRIMRWEFVDMAELCQRATRERVVTDGDTEKLIVLSTSQPWR